MKKIVKTSHKKSTNRIKNNCNTNGGRDEGGFPRNGAELHLNLLVVNVYTTKIVMFVSYLRFCPFSLRFCPQNKPNLFKLTDQGKRLGNERKRQEKVKILKRTKINKKFLRAVGIKVIKLAAIKFHNSKCN